MILKILVPTGVLLEERARTVIFEGRDGSFGLRPRHADFVSALVPGILSFFPNDSRGEKYVAVDRGTLVKYGEEVIVSVRNAFLGESVEELDRLVRTRFMMIDDREKKTRTAVARLESTFLRRLMDLR